MNQCMFYRKLSYTVYIVFNTLSFISDLLASIVYIVMVQCYKGYMYENSWCICFYAIHTIKQICLLLDLYTASVLFSWLSLSLSLQMWSIVWMIVVTKQVWLAKPSFTHVWQAWNISSDTCFASHIHPLYGWKLLKCYSYILFITLAYVAS